MKNTSIVLLCCCGLLSSCDKSNQTGGEVATRIQDETSSMSTDVASVASVASDLTESTAGKLDNALQTAKDAAESLADSAKESSGDAIDAVEDLKQATVEGASAAVNAVKESSSEAVEKTAEVIASVGSDESNPGESIYKSKCFACHGAGIAGAPKLDDKAAWEPRIVQGQAVLSQHAIEGFKGDTGFMPAKGGYSTLSDDEVNSAVKYMISQAQ